MATQTIHFPSARHLSQLYAGQPDNLAHAERLLNLAIVSREDWVRFDGPPEAVAAGEALFQLLNEARTLGLAIRTPDFHRFAEGVARGETAQLRALFTQPVVVQTQRKTTVSKTLGQKL